MKVDFVDGFRRFGVLIALAVFLPFRGYSQEKGLVSLPIIGATTPTTAKVWLLVKDVDNVELSTEKHVHKFSTAGRKSWQGNVPVQFEVTDIPENGSLTAKILLDGVEVGAPFEVKGSPTTFKESWSFMMGSCTLYGVGLSGLIKPGNFTDIFNVMRAMPTDFMIWLGDNVYLLNGEWNSDARMYEKYTKVRLHEPINAFLRSRPNYAVADDHDFGPDNADGTFENKEATVGCYKDFWPNPYFGTAEAKGLFSAFDYQDGSFFLLDDRFEKIEDGNTQILGPAQMAWLKEKLLRSKGIFKFIALGSQVVSEVNAHETWSRFAERQELLDFIKENKIEGVVFLSGDRHFTELCVLKQPGLYPLYDYTSSPLTSILRRQVNNKNDPEYDHALRVPNTKIVAHNFGKITIYGPKGSRTCKMEAFGNEGQLLWTHEIQQSELRF
jgi:alkaline phosphatase D